MSEVTVVGSGASGVHFARALLERGHRVRLVDVGHSGSPPPLPDSDWLELKDALDAPIDYFLGSRLEAAVLPENDEDIYGFPPSKRYVFETPEGFAFEGQGFEPLYSFARGGLAETWTAGCYPFNREETADFPFPYEDLASAYDDVALRIGISGELDDLARFFPAHEGLQPGHALDEHASRLLDRYERRRGRLNRELGCYVGRTRVAALSRPLGDRPACADLGRCMWGCPVRAFYTPALTLAELREHPEFRYEPGVRVLRFDLASGRVVGLVGRRTEGGEVRFPVEHLALAAGALSSAEIYLRSMHAAGSEPLQLEGLMDNRQVLVPFVHLGMIGRRYEPRSYQYHLIGVGLEGDDPKGYVHGQITTLKQALVHPVIQKMPFDLATSTRMIAAIHAALGVVNLNFHDTRRPENRVVFDPGLGRDG
ncbi:MAG: hypothetical protein R3266_07705, partial [Gemmatimonadota bacterium]|nr:hypothetical protein [Gemmatimonadota bacterium]